MNNRTEKLDKYAFADQRKDVPKEKNNEYENKLLNRLSWYILSNEQPGDEDSVWVTEFLKNGEYADVFVKPKVEYVYRGMIVSEDYLKNAIKKQPEDSGDLNARFVFEPLELNRFTSWTTKKDIAADFATGYRPKNPRYYGVIMRAKTSENDNALLECTELLHKILGTTEYTSEHEVIGIYDINVDHVEWKLTYEGDENADDDR